LAVLSAVTVASVLTLVVAVAVRRRLAVIVRQVSAAQAVTAQTLQHSLQVRLRFVQAAAAVGVHRVAVRQVLAVQVQAVVQQVEQQQPTQVQAAAAV